MSLKPQSATVAKNPMGWIFATWHKDVLAEFKKDFSDLEMLMDAERRTVYIGLKLQYTKMRGKADHSIPHGQFWNFIAHHFPEVPRSTLAYCIWKAKSICERMGWKLESLPEFKVPPHQLLINGPKDLPAKLQKEKQLLLDLIEMRGKFQPTVEYKQIKAGDDLGDEKTKLGRRKGEGGATHEQRARAQQLEEAEKLNALIIKVETLTEWLIKSDKELGLLAGTPQLTAFDKAMETARGYIKHGGGK